MLVKWSVQVRPPVRALSYAPTFIGQWWRLAQEKKTGRLKTQVRKTKVPEDGICKYEIRKYECARVENASTENASTNLQQWKT